MRLKLFFLLISVIFYFGCAGSHYQALPSAPKMEKGQQRIAVNFSVSLGQKRKLKWYIPENWWISNWGYSLEYRYGIGKDTDIGIYPAGLKILPCAIDIRWLDKQANDTQQFHRMELLYNPITANENISNAGLRYDYFSKKAHLEEDIQSLQGVSLLLLNFWDVSNGGEHYFHPILGVFTGGESENVLYEFDYLPGFNYFMHDPSLKNPIVHFSEEKKNIPKFLSGDIFFGISHGNSYTE